ncbi:type II secretion system protein [Halobacillus salinus]|uniref:Type II secretion system protein n=1 Tax=Halobacillus salinus TaxID=192814 RepID=A0A4Z0H2R0_9BACI|nr:type II secretion system protein [Halobacillus salinus]TGB04154.1 type II secretion system protein [Halobacillus salinus]
MYHNEKGITLVEILVSIALFSVVVTLFLSLFSDYMVMTKRVENEVDSINLAEEVAYYIESSGVAPTACGPSDEIMDITNALEDYESFGLDSSNQLYYTSPENQRYYPVVKKLCSGRTAQEENLQLIPIKIEVLRKNSGGTNTTITETYRYLSGSEVN